MTQNIEARIAPQVNTNASSRQSNFACVELFAGAGGLALGTHAAGFRHLLLVETNAHAVETLRENSERVLGINPDLILRKDAGHVDYTRFTGKVELLAGGPPCQPFSNGGRHGGHEDERNLFPLFLDTVAIIRPKAVLIENVKGLTTARNRPYLEYILKRLRFPLCAQRGEDWKDHLKRLDALTESDFAENEQYVVNYQLVDAADFGVPQRRERVFIFAFRRDLGIQPFQLNSTHSRQALLHEQWVTGTYWERHSIDSCRHLRTMDEKYIQSLKPSLFSSDSTRSWRTVREGLSGLPAPVNRGEETTFPNHLQHPGARMYPSHTGSILDQPSKALKAGTHGTPGGENMLRDLATDNVRYYTIREAARIQTFPDDWLFHGPWGACLKQLGNAVPVELAQTFAKAIYDQLAAVSIANSGALEGKNDAKHQIKSRHHASSTNPASIGRDRTQALAVRG